MTNNPTNWLARYQAEWQQRHAQLPILKNALLNELSRHGIVSAVIEYDGEGDSGQIEGLAAFGASDQLIALARPLHDQIEEFAWEVLAAHHDGFENNDGGYGDIAIDVTKRTVVRNHNARFSGWKRQRRSLKVLGSSTRLGTPFRPRNH